MKEMMVPNINIDISRTHENLGLKIQQTKKDVKSHLI